jgi:glycosyltransferase involved in cell wall biosynthesis
MLDSCLPHVDYYVMQDNGSTDGTTDIAKQFLIDNKLSGEIYFCEEGWKGFGWNRDHLIQYCQNKTNHGCDWILKMDCDEILEVDSDFDWSPLDNKETHSFHIPIKAGTAYYFRAWMYNAKMPWRFNHDLCHETVYCELPEIGLNFQRYDLDTKFRHVGFNEGQSWSNPTKFISDALKLEEELISKGTMTDNLYHFWYIGKSYLDSYQSNSFPLGVSQKKEYARRAIYYFEEFVKYVQKMRNGKVEIDETNYLSLNYAGECYRFLGEINSAITSYYRSEQFAPERNDHLFALAEIYKTKNDFEKMLEVTSKMMQSERTNPFPKYCNFIDGALYHDSPLLRVQNLHEFA